MVATNAILEGMLGEVEARRMPLAVPELVEQLAGIGRRHDRAAAEPFVDAPGVGSIPPIEAAAPADEATPPLSDELDEQLLPIFLEEGAELVRDLHGALRNWQGDHTGTEHPKACARLLHTLKGSARMAGAMVLGQHVHQLESRLEAARPAGQDPAPLIEELVSGLDVAEQMIQFLAGCGEPVAALPGELAAVVTPAAVAIDAAPGESDAGIGGATLRVRAEAVDRFVNEAGEIGIARTRIEGELRTLRRSLLDLTENVIRLRNQLREVEIQAEMQMQSRIAQTETLHGDFDPLEMDRYTRLQELTRMMAESVGDVTTVQQSLLRNLDGADLALHSQARLSRDLQQALMKVRMVPFDSLADRLYRVVRQTAKELGKRANLDLRGGRIEIDRSVLEHMTAPLEHLLRNAVAHGIESATARAAAGKDEIGQITLSVTQEGNEIAISLADDGSGLDYARIAERARVQGLLGADEVADERRLTNLIFIPGFSTAGNVSTVSGRGVGMDVVKSETAAVGGRIDVRATPGKGSEFRIYLPLTLAVTQAVLVRAANRSYAIPSRMIAQVMELKADAMDKLRAAGGTEWQGEHFAYRYLPHLLGDRNAQPELQRFNWVLLLRAGAQTLALHVDALRGNQEIVVKNAGPQLVRIVGISGATVLGDGEIVLIVNPVALASRGLASGEPEPGAAVPSGRETVMHQPTVMVVDDSLTVRKITGRLLEREGYRVITAKDGVDALEVLLETLPDVILSDIEMPRMDGFDLLRNIRADQRTRAIPVIMITSRLADKHRDYAARIGADHYLGKPYDEEELLGLLRGYIASPVTA
jgi:chemosensory pili system protein ChpA (sensor histidine kinase/response regulator)